MKTIQEYLKKEFGYVSKWWKYLFLFFLIDIVAGVVFIYSFYDGTGDLGEWYFNFNGRIFYVGYME